MKRLLDPRYHRKNVLSSANVNAPRCGLTDATLYQNAHFKPSEADPMPIYPCPSAIEPSIDLPSSASRWAYPYINLSQTPLSESTIEADFIPSPCAKLPKNLPKLPTTRRISTTTST